MLITGEDLDLYQVVSQLVNGQVNCPPHGSNLSPLVGCWVGRLLANRGSILRLFTWSITM